MNNMQKTKNGIRTLLLATRCDNCRKLVTIGDGEPTWIDDMKQDWCDECIEKLGVFTCGWCGNSYAEATAIYFHGGVDTCGKCHDLFEEKDASSRLIDWKVLVAHILLNQLGFTYDGDADKYRKNAKINAPLNQGKVSSFLIDSHTTLREIETAFNLFLELTKSLDTNEMITTTVEQVEEILRSSKIYVDEAFSTKIDDFILANVVWDFDMDSLLDKEFEV